VITTLCPAKPRSRIPVLRVALLVALAGVAHFLQAAPESARPNVLLIVSDDQGWRDAACLGRAEIQTPNLDRLARDGVRATSFYVTWPACTPSRGSVLTGRHPLRNGLYDMIRNDMVNFGHRFTPQQYAVSPEMTLGLDTREVTLGDALKRAGYRTGLVGKWDMGQAKRFLPLQRGYDFFYGHGNNGIDYYTHERYGVPSLFRGNDRTEADKGIYATTLFQREALRFIRESAGRPWYLHLCFNAPHSASTFEKEGVQVPQEFVRLYPARDPADKLTRYFAAVTCMDAAIGEVLSAIRELGAERDTIVLFLSDNGGSGNGGNAPLRGAKSSLWEGGLRVPFIARWPARIPAGAVTDEFLTTLELFPTLLAATGAKPTAGVVLDGFDMLPVLAGRAKSQRTEMFWEFRGEKAARIGNLKWVDSAKGKGLFDLTADISEKNDLSASQAATLEMISARWSAWRREMEAAEPRGPFRDY